MFKQLFGNRPTSKTDVILGIAGAVAAVWRAYDVSKQYRLEQEAKELNA